MLAQRWRDSISRMHGVTVVANADDPLVVWATGVQEPRAADGPTVLFVAAGELWHDDATGCPACGGRISFEPLGGWSCTCGFSRPEPYAQLTSSGLELRDGRVVPISLSLPARCNRSNAAMAAVAAGALGTDEALALEAMKSVGEVEGRFSSVFYEGVSARLLLAKNPAGWAELLDLLRNSETPVVVGINSRTADGHDPSWLWDVGFEELAGRLVVATGERSKDLAVRLRYAGVKHRVLAEQGSALLAPAAPSIEYVGNYTAFQQLRRIVSRRHPSSRSNGSPRSRAPAIHTFEALTVPVATESGKTLASRSSRGARSTRLGSAGRGRPSRSARHLR